MNAAVVPGSPEHRINRAANWFYWIAALSTVNSVSAVSGGSWGFFIGLGCTQVVDGIARHFHSSPATVAGLALDGLAVLLFVTIGYFGRQYRWLFTLGLVVFGLDALICLAFQDWPMAAFHAFAIFAMSAAYRGFKELKLEREAATSSPTAAPIQPAII
jgi:hypothetical protein